MVLENKKGSISDLPYIIGGVFSVILVALVVSLLISQFDDKVQTNDIFNSNARDASDRMVDDIPTVMNFGIVFIYFSLVIISLVLASLVPVHPVFLIFYLLEWFILIYLGGGIANAYQVVIENPIFVDTVASQFQLASFFFRYFPFFIGITGAVLAIAVYKTRERFTGGGI